MSSRELVDQARQEIGEVAPRDLDGRLQGSGRLLDVREPDEVLQGVLPDAVLIPRGFLELRVEGAIPDRATPVTVYCASGVRSLLAAKTLRSMGYSDVVSLQGGFNAWKDQGMPFTVPHNFTAEQRERYSRHFLLGEVAEAGQARLLDAKVLVLG
ncbi:MAG: rhodanese-like domain-containing protein, partial [Candidatus Dormiibacterota bacterium]